MGFFRKDEGQESSIPQEIVDLRSSVAAARLPEHVSAACAKELDRLERTDPSIAEYSIGVNYVDYLLSLPWNRYTHDNLDLNRAERILESKHFGLQHVKERILEFLAVRTMRIMNKGKILVVDDEEVARRNIVRALQKDAYEVGTAANGLEALARVEAEDFDVVITDLKMEKMDGLQLLESLKRTSPLTDIIMVTGYATVDSAVTALTRGAAYYLAKPFQFDELRSTVSQILNKKRHAQVVKGPVLCFAGPPGTGKTSIGEAIAEAMERKFLRISLAGLRDESELRGHRRTYVGAMPGRIVSEIRRLSFLNPVFMLDEIDKIGQDFRGDTASILLEILDPQQNQYFVDNYVELPFDLSAVMFIATANVVDNLPGPLLDRLEVIPFPGYTELEKMEIASDYLIPRQLKEHGLNRLDVEFTPSAVSRIIEDYTREAGLRNLEREIAAICRKLVRSHLNNGQPSDTVTIDRETVPALLGPRRFSHEVAESQDQVGVTTGLVWSEFGGEIVFVEATLMKGEKQLILTGSLGDILRESAQTALSYIRSRAGLFHINPDFFSTSDIHIHIPAGAIPKDGPSAGVTIAAALISLLTNRPARREVALTGEITLSGRLLPVSGIREKLLAAQRAGVKTVVLPKKNEIDVASLPEKVTEGLNIVFADEIAQFLDVVLLSGEAT
ncbi:MAG: endopeptidase La [Deltaproteobacteria bacterium]